MASFQAVHIVCQSVIDLLRDNYDPADFAPATLNFRVNRNADFRPAGGGGGGGGGQVFTGVTLYLYRILPNGTYRTPPGRPTGPNKRQRNRLPVDLHFILTAWADDAATQLDIAGWMMRVMEDWPTMPPALMNRVSKGAFNQDESVELMLGEIATEDLLRLWEALRPNAYEISIPYVARNVWIESRLEAGGGGVVQERQYDYQLPRER
jgi:hypothetical protein